MKIQKKIYLFLLCLLLVAGASTGTEEEPSKSNIPLTNIGDTIKGISYKIDQGRSSHYLRVGELSGKYLFLAFTKSPVYSHLNITLTVYSLQSQISIRRCISEEIDSCYIDKEKLTKDESLLIVVEEESKEEYEYEIRSYWSNLEHVQVGKEIKFMFSKLEQKQIYHLDLKKESFQEVKIIIKPLTRRYAFDKVKMYGTYGQNSVPTSQNYDFQSVYLWQDVQGIYLTKKQMKETNVNLILYGQIQTIYSMKCQLIKDDHHNIELNSKIYEYLSSGQKYNYHIQFKKQGSLNYEEYIFRVAKFTGNLSLHFFADEGKKNRTKTIEPLMYMGDIQYIFKQEEIEKEYPDGIYIVAKAKNKFTTYTMQFQGRMKANALELHEHVYEFQEVKARQIMFVKVAKYMQKDSKQTQPILKLIFSFMKIKGSTTIEFRKCLDEELICTGQKYLNVTQKIETQLRNIGTKDIHTITLKEDFWKHVNIVQQNAIIVIVLTNTDKDTSSFAALEYNIGNRPEFLRENKPIESHILKDEIKIYKYMNTDPNVDKIRIHINKINGELSSFIFRKEESAEEAKKEDITEHLIQGNVFETTEELLTKPIVIVVRGEDSATYSIIVQVIHQSNEEISSIILSENVNFKTTIGPNKYEIFAVNPILGHILFNYKASGAVHVCQLNSLNACEDKEFKFQNEGQILKENFQGRTLFVKIRNPSSNKNIEVSTIFTSKKTAQCENRKMGQLYKEIVTEGSCLSTVISQAQDFDITIIREQLGHLSYTMFLCDKLLSVAIKQTGEQRYSITKEQLKASCQGHSQFVFSFTANGKIGHKADGSIQQIGNMHIKYLVQYKGDNIILPDGIAYHGKNAITEQPLNRFSYKIINKINTTIMAISQNSLYFLIKIIQASNSKKETIGMSDYHFSSEKTDYYFMDYVFFKLDKESFRKYPCKQCQLLVYLYSKDAVGQVVEYNVEISQNFVFLEQGHPKKGFLTQNSYAYYGFAIKQKGEIIIQASDNNQNCIELYSSNEEYPDESRFVDKSFDGQIIVEVDGSSPNYYITVKARRNCPYSIVSSLSTGKNHLVKLIRGSLGYANLQEKEVKYYTFKHLSQKPFKILSLHTYGHVQFYLNKTTQENLIQLFKKDTIDYETFSFHSSHKNRLFLQKTEAEFCKDCTYVLAVVARKHTESSIFLGDDETKVPLTEEKVLNDILTKTNDITKAEMYRLDEGALQVKVHTGKLQVTISYNQQSLTKIFLKNVALQRFDFKFNKEVVNNYFTKGTITFKALQQITVYSSRVINQDTIKNQKEPGTKHSKINTESSNYAYLEKSMISCYDGYLKRADEKIFISFSSHDKDLVKELAIIAKLDGNLTSITKQHTRNVIAVKYIDAVDFQAGAKPFQICLQSMNRSIAVTIIQEEETNLLPENVEMLVVQEQMYDLYTEGNMLLDVFECRGSTKVAFGQDRKELENKKPKVLQMIGMPNQPHAIKLATGYQNVLIRVSGELSLIRWLPIKQDQEKGMGYYLYEAGKLKYNNVFGQLQFLIDPIKTTKKTQTQVKSVKYNLYISNKPQDLQAATNCQNYLAQNVISYHVAQEHLIDRSFKFILVKNKLLLKYNSSENLYANVVADVVIVTKDKSEEEYRFIYNSQEIPAIVFMPNQIERYDVSILMGALVICIFLLLVLAWIFKSVVIPYLGKRNRALVEENLQNSKGQPEPQIKDDNLEPLPSTERQGMNMQAQTDTKM